MKSLLNTPLSIIAGNLRLRFLMAMLLWVALGIGVIWFSATRVFTIHVERSYHEELEVHVRELARLTIVDRDGKLKLLRPLSDPRYEVPLSGFYWQVTTPGQPPLRSPSMTRGSLDEDVAHAPSIAHKLENGPTGPTITYGFSKTAPDGSDVHYVIATDQAELDRVIDSFRRELSLWLGALGVLLSATGLAIIRFGLRPLERLGESIGRLRRGEAARLEGEYPAEIAPLVADLNRYVEQNGKIIARARVQAGNLAHSLRTPLAVISDEAERLGEHKSTQAASRALLEQITMMEQQIEYQLARARSAAGMRVPGHASRLPDLLHPILRAMRRLHSDIDFFIGNETSDSLALPVDPVDLAELLSILLDNAGKWARSTVFISYRQIGDGGVEIRVQDDGPGMSPQQIAQAFDLGTRFDTAKPGSGLGLAIARDISETMNAALTLEQTPLGLCAIVAIGPNL